MNFDLSVIFPYLPGVSFIFRCAILAGASCAARQKLYHHAAPDGRCGLIRAEFTIPINDFVWLAALLPPFRTEVSGKPSQKSAELHEFAITLDAKHNFLDLNNDPTWPYRQSRIQG
ncbi:hypothetical protein [Roseovarius sp.]|uniref:hypothetical protein n=1 Tax=Roseovarius sp. TaxID=1486281 RepID=UPI003D0ED36B